MSGYEPRNKWAAVWQKGDSRRRAALLACLRAWSDFSEPELDVPVQVPLRTARRVAVLSNLEGNDQRMNRVERWIGCLSSAGLAAFLSACAGAPRDASLPVDDPNEQFNRGVLHVNQVVLDPAASVVKSVPGVIRDRFQDLDANLKEPRVFANDILQARFNAAGITLGRFVFNSIFGLGGLFDVAAQGGLPQQTGDFGQTMFVWGVPSGSYTVSPYFGPSTQRDSIGGVVDTVGDPVGWVVGGLVVGWPWTAGTAGLGAVAHLAQWKQAESSSVDFYTFLRSSYYQTRRAQLREALGLPPEIESPATPGPVVGSAATVQPAAGSPGYEIPPPQ
jgi:phospholipid-binding lipoprotein MlaA